MGPTKNSNVEIDRRLAMSDPACDKKVTTPPVTLRSPLTPPPTDKDAPDTTSIRRQIAQHRLCHPTQTIHNVDKKLWDDLQPLLEYHKTHCEGHQRPWVCNNI